MVGLEWYPCCRLQLQIVLNFETSDPFEAETCGIMTTTGPETKNWL